MLLEMNSIFLQFFQADYLTSGFSQACQAMVVNRRPPNRSHLDCWTTANLAGNLSQGNRGGQTVMVLVIRCWDLQVSKFNLFPQP